MKTYELDPAHFYTSPGLLWNALLKYSEVKLEHIRDPDMLLMVERGIRKLRKLFENFEKTLRKLMNTDLKCFNIKC